MDKPARIIACVTCDGDGLLQTQRGEAHLCPTCRGNGVAAAWGAEWWSWRHPLSDLSILERRWERIVWLSLNGLLMVFVLAGLALGAPTLYQAFNTGQLLDVLVAKQSWNIGAFWLGILCALYLTYRFEKEATMFPTIPAAMKHPSDQVWAQPDRHLDMAAVSTPALLHVLERSWVSAKHAGSQELAPLHILFELLQVPAVSSMLVRANIALDSLQARLGRMIGELPAGPAAPILSASARRLIAEALLMAAERRRNRVTPTFLMAAIARLEDPARELLFDLGLDERKLNHIVGWLMIQDELRQRLRHYQDRVASKPKGVIDRGYTAAATPMLDRFSTDLTLQARANRLPFVIGREQELQRIFRIMESGRHSVVIVGDVGVGKTHLLYAVAEAMAAEDVPETLQDKRLVSLSAAALVAGAGGIGELEQRMETILQEIIRSGNIVLAIEHLEQLVGVSSSGGQGLDAASMLAQELQKRTFVAIATADIEAYRRYVEHGTLLSAFERVELQEMDVDQSITVLESQVPILEHKHGVFYSYDAIEQSVELTHRYVHEQTLPGKAFEVLEEVGVMVKRERGNNSLVTGTDVAEIVTERTKIKVSDVTGDERKKLLHLEEDMHQRMIGQDEAVKAVANALRRARAELRDTRRPIANLLFLGPTGVGKTELAKTVAATYFGSEEAMIRLDMSEYQDVASLNRLIGAPPGFADSKSGGYLSEAVRHQPFALVLLDELEKAHPDILNIFLQVMDDGRLTDSAGRTIDFTNVILIATSNAGTQHIQNRLRESATIEQIKTELMNRELQQYFRPEFLNRFDSVVVFKPLQKSEIRQIVGLMIGQISKQLLEKGITLQATEAAMNELAEIGFDPVFGARPLRRAVQERVDNALAEYLLQGKLGRRDVAILEPGGVVRVEKAKAVGTA